jgi:flagellar biogenesis protein FliO
MTFETTNRLPGAEQLRASVRTVTVLGCSFAAMIVCALPVVAQQGRPGNTQEGAEYSTPLRDPRLSRLIQQQTQQSKQRRSASPISTETSTEREFSSPVFSPPGYSTQASATGSQLTNTQPQPSTASTVSSVLTREANDRQTALRDLEHARIQRASFQAAQESTRESESSTPSLTPVSTVLRATPTVADDAVVRVNGTAKTTRAAEPEMFLDLSSEKPLAPSAASGSSATNDGPEVTMNGNPTHVLTRAVAWIVIALCLFSLAALGVRHWQRQRGLLPTSNTRSRVLETLSLGPGRSVSLIEMAGYRALVAFDAGGIKQLVLTPTLFQDELSAAETYEPHPATVELKVMTEN